MADIAANKKAFHNFEILETIEAGLVLTGAEIKAVRTHQVSLIGSYARLLHSRGVADPELFWVGGTISVIEGDKLRSRKLLLHRRELNRLIGKLQEKGWTLIPLRLYFSRGRAKLELGLGRGKKIYDKRETIKRRQTDRALDRVKKFR